MKGKPLVTMKTTKKKFRAALAARNFFFVVFIVTSGEKEVPGSSGCDSPVDQERAL